MRATSSRFVESCCCPKDGALAPDLEDEILKAALVVHGGAIIHPALQQAA